MFSERSYQSMELKKLNEFADASLRGHRSSDHSIMSELFHISQTLERVGLRRDLIAYSNGKLFVVVSPGLVPTGNNGWSYSLPKKEDSAGDFLLNYPEDGIANAFWFNEFLVGELNNPNVPSNSISILTSGKDITDRLCSVDSLRNIKGEYSAVPPHIEGSYQDKTVSIYTHSEKPVTDFSKALSREKKERAQYALK